MQNSLNLTEKFVMKFTINSLNTKVANTFTELLTIYCFAVCVKFLELFLPSNNWPIFRGLFKSKKPQKSSKVKNYQQVP